MFRTTIMLPVELKGSLEKAAKGKGVSFGELVRQALQKYLLLGNDIVANEPFFTNRTTFVDKGERDGARRHDAYLADINPHNKKR